MDWPAQVLAAGERDPRAGVVPAHGLVLEEVLYPPDEELAVRAEQIRARRMDEHLWMPGDPQGEP